MSRTAIAKPVHLRLTACIATAAACTLFIAGCNNQTNGGSSSGSNTASSDTSTGASTSPAGPTLDVTIAGKKVTPNGERIKVKVGQPVTLNVTSDRAGELHVHSTPEQHLKYQKGKTKLKVTIDKPGIVDVEDHVADVVVAQLEVS